MGLALAMIPVVLYPLFRRQNHVLALGYVVFRGAIEPTAYLLMATSRLLLILFSQQYAGWSRAVCACQCDRWQP